MPEAENTFERGMKRSLNERTQKKNTIFDSVNGSLYFDDDGNTAWRPIEGNKRVLVFDGSAIDPDFLNAVDPGNGAEYFPIGGCSFADCLVVLTVREDTPNNHMVIWIFQFNEDDQAYGQVLISDRQYPAGERFDQQLWNNMRVRPLFENDQLYRVQWCDGVESDSNPLRSITFKLTGTTSNPTYNGSIISGTFKTFSKLANTTPVMTNAMAPFQMGVIHFMKRVPGSVWSGRYTYLYRLIKEDGYRTPWSHPTNEVFVTTDIIDGTTSANMHQYEMEESGTPSSIGNRLFIRGVDQNYKWIEAAYVYIPDATNIPTIAASFSFVEITSSYHEVDHISMEGEALDVNELISTRLNIRAAQTIEIKDEHLWVGNYKTGQLNFTNQEIEDVLANLEVVHIFREMSVDKEGKTDKAYSGFGPRSVLYNVPIVNSETATMTMNDVDTLTLPIESDFPTYRGQQVDNSFVGYPRDETERLGIVFYDTEGNAGFVYHLCDYKFPKMFNGDNVADVLAERIDTSGNVLNVLDAAELALHKKAWLSTGQADTEAISNIANYPSILQRPVKDGDNSLTDEVAYGNATRGYMKETYLRLMGLKFDGIDVSGIKDRISGFAIVRCKTEYTTLAQGIISPTIIYEGNEKTVKPTPRPENPIRMLVNDMINGTPKPTTAHNNNFRTTFNDDALRDRCKPNDPPRLEYVDEFATAYIPEVMFDIGNLPSYDSNHFLELVQICWEEYNCGLDIEGHPLSTQVTSYPDPLYGEGPQLCNMFLRDPRNRKNAGSGGATRWTNSTKLSWHLMFNTRLQDFYDGSPYALPYKHDIPFSNGLQLLTGHPQSNAYNGNAGLPSYRWAYPDQLFPIYGDTIEPDYIRLVDSNEKVATIDTANPDWSFHNHTKYWCNSVVGSAPFLPHQFEERCDDYYGGFKDINLHHVHDGGIQFGGDDNQREMTGHANTLLIKYDGSTKRNNVAGPARFLFCAVIPTWAEMLFGGPSSAIGRYYTCDPNIGAAARWIFNWKRVAGSLYGGQSITALQNNIFIGTGHFQPVGNGSFNVPPNDVYNNIEVWGGDCWLDAHSACIQYPSYSHDDGPGRNNSSGAGTADGFYDASQGIPASLICPLVAFQRNCQQVTLPEHSDGGFIMVFPHESRWNLCLRSAPSPGNPNSADVGLQPRATYEGWGNHSEWEGGLFRYDGKSGNNSDPSKHYLEEFFINEVLRYDDLLRPFVPKPRGFNAVNHFPLRWAYSGGGRKTDGDIVDVFREFFVNNWRDINGEYGEIRASTFFMDDVYSFQTRAHGRLRIYERSLMQTDGTEPIVTGEGDVISGIQYISQIVGCQHPESLLSTPKGMYWVDGQSRSLYYSDGKSPVNLSDVKGMNQLLRQLLWRYVDGFSIYGNKGVSIHTGYDPDRNNVEFSFPALYDGLLTSNGSKRYNFTQLLTATGTQYGSLHEIANIDFVDKDSEAVPTIAPPDNTIPILDQDVVILGNQLVTGANPISININLFQGLYGIGLTPKRNLTVKEFYVVIPDYQSNGWVVNFVNKEATSPTLATADIVYPDQSSTTEIEGYRYSSSNYPNVVDQSMTHDGVAGVFHLYRSAQDGRFQVRRLPNLAGAGIMHGASLRGRLIYNEDAEEFHRWETLPSTFNVIHRSKLISAVEHNIIDGLFMRNERVPDVPKFFEQEFIAWLTYLVNELNLANKIFDNYRLNTNDLKDIYSLRFNTKDQAIVLFVQNDSRIKLKRDILRAPIRRRHQIDRVRGEYLMVDVQISETIHKLAYCFTSRTLYRVSHRN